jgi:hypothetical protein
VCKQWANFYPDPEHVVDGAIVQGQADYPDQANEYPGQDLLIFGGSLIMKQIRWDSGFSQGRVRD